MTIETLMTTEVVTVTPATPIKRVAQLLTRHRISGVPVLTDDGTVLGVVSEADILRGERGIPLTAGEAMTSPALTIAPVASVNEAARIMTARGINRLPVVQDGRLVGIVSRADLVRAFQRSDDEIADELNEDVLLHQLWLSPEDVVVAVEDGIVELTGRVENKTQAELVAAYALRVPGVVDVLSNIDWAVDDQAIHLGRIPRRL
jgi:predicted transcriptional regulator